MCRMRDVSGVLFLQSVIYLFAVMLKFLARVINDVLCMISVRYVNLKI